MSDELQLDELLCLQCLLAGYEEVIPRSLCCMPQRPDGLLRDITPATQTCESMLRGPVRWSGVPVVR